MHIPPRTAALWVTGSLVAVLFARWLSHPVRSPSRSASVLQVEVDPPNGPRESPAGNKPELATLQTDLEPRRVVVPDLEAHLRNHGYEADTLSLTARAELELELAALEEQYRQLSSEETAIILELVDRHAERGDYDVLGSDPRALEAHAEPNDHDFVHVAWRAGEVRRTRIMASEDPVLAQIELLKADVTTAAHRAVQRFAEYSR